MKKLTIAIMCLAGGLAMAQEADEKESEVTVEEMQIRLTTMEEINVTAEKTPVESSEEVDSEIDAILLDAEKLDVEE